MKQLFKISAVLITVASVTFMGVSAIAYFVHPHPWTAMQTEAMLRYEFNRVPGETVTWSVKRRFGDPQNNTVGGSYPNEYAAIIAAHKDLASQLGSETSQAREAFEKLKNEGTGEIARFETSQAQDTAAMQQRITALEQVHANLTDEHQKLSEQLQALSVRSKAIHDETAARGTDVARLRNELEEARTDLFRLRDLQRTLTDQLVRIQIEIQTLQDRREQLQQQL